MLIDWSALGSKKVSSSNLCVEIRAAVKGLHGIQPYSAVRDKRLGNECLSPTDRKSRFMAFNAMTGVVVRLITTDIGS